ncbi:MAG: hypothetical protein KBT35_01220 [Firmicutes bacterium]|nr:hypothetical protein [Candidatus Colivicinus equi]
MSVNSEINRIQQNIEEAYDSLEEKGATMPASKNTNNLASTIDTIPTGGGVSDVRVNDVSKVTDGIANIESTDSNDIDDIFHIKHKITLTNNGNATYGYVTINGTNVTAAGDYEVNDGDTITFKCYGRSGTYYGSVTIDGTEVLRATSTTATSTYTYIVNKDVTVTFNINTTSRYGRLTAVTSESELSNPDRLVNKKSLNEYSATAVFYRVVL